MGINVIKPVYDFSEPLDVWIIKDFIIDVTDYQEYYYIDFEYTCSHGSIKRARYSEFSDMIYGIEEYDLTCTDLTTLLHFINLNLYKTKEFQQKINDLMTVWLSVEYIDY